MNLPPILAALRKHKPSVAMVVLQVAVTLAIVCNAVFIIGHQIERANRPTGLDENNLFIVTQIYADAPTGNNPAALSKLDAMERTDIETLRRLPEVTSAAMVNSLPLMGTGTQGAEIRLRSDQRDPTVGSAGFYFVDSQALTTLGLHLVAGRNFTHDEIKHVSPYSPRQSSVVIVTQALAKRLFPHGNALGKVIYLSKGAAPSTIIGIVARLQAGRGWMGASTWYSVLQPAQWDFYFTTYAVRARPGQMQAAMRGARKALYAVDPMRILNGMQGAVGIHSYASIRARAYRSDRGMAIVMGVISLILLAITGAGMVGVTSFWVGQRTKQIGIRRALGARRANILHYFQIENLIIADAGVVLGVILAVALNLWLMQQFQMQRLPLLYVLVGVAILLILGQGAVFAPALRASKVSPVEATRSV